MTVGPVSKRWFCGKSLKGGSARRPRRLSPDPVTLASKTEGGKEHRHKCSIDCAKNSQNVVNR